jgi:sugar lactone lactonase YvrE
MTLVAEQFSESLAYHAEGVVWIDGAVQFVDMFAGDILRLDAAGGLVERRHVGSLAGCIRPRAAGGLVIAVERGFALLSADGAVQHLPEVWSDPAVRMNEGATDPHGGFYAGSMAWDAEKSPFKGTLYYLAPTFEVTTVMTGLSISNGLAWSPDSSFAYFTDTPTRRLDILEFGDPGELLNRRPFRDVSDLGGTPDGLTVDAEGGVWVAFYNGSCVRRFTPDGVLDEEVRLPVTRITSCTFGGPDLDELYITTSRENLPPGEEPQAGAIFRVSPGVTGLPAPAFAS